MSYHTTLSSHVRVTPSADCALAILFSIAVSASSSRDGAAGAAIAAPLSTSTAAADRRIFSIFLTSRLPGRELHSDRRQDRSVARRRAGLSTKRRSICPRSGGL